MKTHHLPQVQSIIINSGFVAMGSPSVDHPIPVSISYRTNADGSVRWLWPEGSKCQDFSKFYFSNQSGMKWKTTFNKVCFILGLGRFIAHGRLVMYTDLPTATYILTQWRSNN